MNTLQFIYPDFAAKTFDCLEKFIEHLPAQQQKMHDIIRRKTNKSGKKKLLQAQGLKC